MGTNPNINNAVQPRGETGVKKAEPARGGNLLPGFRVRYQTVEFGQQDFHLRTLRDKQQFDDKHGVAEALGISSATWPLFGVLWDSGRALAHLMLDYDVAGRKVLEIGCGIGLASIVLQGRDANITATDYHPEAEAFLEQNAALNNQATIPFVRTGWQDTDQVDVELGSFDLIIGSDLLYERGHAGDLAAFIERHARPDCVVVILDPGRGNTGRFGRNMAEFGFSSSSRVAEAGDRPDAPYRGRVLEFVRAT